RGRSANRAGAERNIHRDERRHPDDARLRRADGVPPARGRCAHGCDAREARRRRARRDRHGRRPDHRLPRKAAAPLRAAHGHLRLRRARSRPPARGGTVPVPRPDPAPARRGRARRGVQKRRGVVRHRHRPRAPAGGRGVRAGPRGVRLVTETELERIRAEYEARDAATAASPYRWDNPGYVAYMQLVERALLDAFRDAGVKLEGARVLDVGAGSGYFLQRLIDYGAAEGHGIDLMEERVAAGRRRYPALHLRVGNGTELPYGDGEFDLVTQFTCLSSILD